jgi:hypothetical protein
MIRANKALRKAARLSDDKAVQGLMLIDELGIDRMITLDLLGFNANGTRGYTSDMLHHSRERIRKYQELIDDWAKEQCTPH